MKLQKFDKKVIYDVSKDADQFINLEKQNLKKEIKEKEECKIDSDQLSEKFCKVFKDSTGYYDVMMTKVDVKKYYYGMNNFYVA